MTTTILTYLAAILFVVLIVLGWALVQHMWKNVFHDHINDPDVLAGRRSCGNCGCTTACKTRTSEKKKFNIQ